MRVGCCAYSYRQYLTKGEMDLLQFIDLAADLGLDGVELTAYYFQSTDDAYLDKVKRRALKTGLTVAGAAVGNRFTFADPAEREKQIADVKRWLQISARLGAPYLRVFAGPVPQGATEEQAFGWVVDSLRSCIPTAREHGVLLALENHGGITTTADQVLHILEAVASDWLVINLDTGNYKNDPYREMERTVPFAVTAHVKTEVVTPEGKAAIDTARLLATLHQAGYQGFLNIEYEAAAEPKTAVPRFVSELRATLAGLGERRAG